MVSFAGVRLLVLLTRKELHATFTSAVGYTVAAVFLLVLGYTFSLTLFATKVSNLTYVFHQMYVLSILLVPVLTMRAFAALIATFDKSDNCSRDVKSMSFFAVTSNGAPPIWNY